MNTKILFTIATAILLLPLSAQAEVYLDGEWQGGGAGAVEGAYNATTWDGNTDAATKDALRDKIETISVAAGATIDDDAGNGDTSVVWSADKAFDSIAAVTPTSLSLLIGTNTQAWSANLDTYSGITPSADVQTFLGYADFAAMLVGMGAQAADADLNIYAGITPSADVQTFLDYADFAAMLAGIGAQAESANLTEYATVNPSAFALTVLDDADAATAQATLGVVPGTNVQAQSAYLADIAGITPDQGDMLYFNGTDWVVIEPSTDGYFLKTQGDGANPVWSTPAGGGDVTAIGTCDTGDCFVDGSTTSTSLVFEMTDNAYETTITVTDPTADHTATFPDATGTVLFTDGVGTALTALNGENIQDDTIDDDSIDFADVTGADFTLTDAVAVTTSGAITSGGLLTGSAGLTVATGQDITLGVTTWNSGDSIDGEAIADDTIDDDSIDFGDVTLADITFDVEGVSTAEYGRLDGLTEDLVTTLAAKADIAGAEAISGVWEVQDDTLFNFGNDADFGIRYDETTDDQLEIVSNSDTDTTIDISNAGAGDTNIEVDGDITSGGVVTGDSLVMTPTDDGVLAFDAETANESEWWFGVNHDSAGDDDDAIEIRQSATPGSSVELSLQPDGDLIVTGDVTITGDDLVMGTNTNTAILVADGNTFNPVVPSGDVAITNAGATAVSDLTITSEAQGDILYFNGTNWVRLAPGTDGYYLETNGAAANPSWSAVSASAAGADTNVQYNSSGNLGGEAAFTYTAGTNTLVAENITSSGAITGGTVTDGTITLAGDGTITGVSVGGLPDNIVDNGMMADSAVDTAELAADAVEATKIADNAVDTEHLADDAANSDEIAAGAIDLAHMSVESVDSDQYVDGSVDVAHVEDDLKTHMLAWVLDVSETSATKEETAIMIPTGVTYEDAYSRCDDTPGTDPVFTVYYHATGGTLALNDTFTHDAAAATDTEDISDWSNDPVAGSYIAVDVTTAATTATKCTFTITFLSN